MRNRDVRFVSVGGLKYTSSEPLSDEYAIVIHAQLRNEFRTLFEELRPTIHAQLGDEAQGLVWLWDLKCPPPFKIDWPTTLATN